MHDYTQLAFAGKPDAGRAVRDSLNPAREAFKACKPTGKPQAHAKYWMELLGQVGGPVRRPLLNLTETEKENIRAQFGQSGLVK